MNFVKRYTISYYPNYVRIANDFFQRSVVVQHKGSWPIFSKPRLGKRICSKSATYSNRVKVVWQTRVQGPLEREGACIAGPTRLNAGKPPPILDDLDLRNFKEIPSQSQLCAACMGIRSEPSFPSTPPHLWFRWQTFFCSPCFSSDRRTLLTFGRQSFSNSPKLSNGRLLPRPGVRSFRPCLWYGRTSARQVRRDSLRVFSVIIRDCGFDGIFGEHRAVYCHQIKIGS